MRIALFLITLFSILPISFGQAYDGPESVEYDYTNSRWLIGNKNSNELLARDNSGNLSVLIPSSSIGNTGPYGIEIVDDVIYMCCGSVVKGFNLNTLTEVFSVSTGGTFLNGITHDNSGNLYVTDFSAKIIYKINIAAENSEAIASGLVQSPNGIIFDEENNRCVFVNWGANAPIKALDLSNNTVSTIATTSHSNCDGIALDDNGFFYISIWGGQKVVQYNNDFSSMPVTIVQTLNNPADLFFNTEDLVLGIPNSGNNTVTFYTFTLDVEQLKIKTLNIYPNPCTDQFQIECNSEAERPDVVLIYDLQGRIQKTIAQDAMPIEENKIKIQIENLQSGTYFISVNKGKENWTSKMVIH
jgi:hypothetical protein